MCECGGYSLGMSVEGVMWECGGCTCVSGRLCMVSMEGVHVCVEGVQVCVEGCMCECGGCAWRVRRMCMRECGVCRHNFDESPCPPSCIVKFSVFLLQNEDVKFLIRSQ